MTEPSINAIRVKCLDCNEEYAVEPSRTIGNESWYSSDIDHCRKCGSMNLSNLSFSHPEEVHLEKKSQPVYPNTEELIPSILRSKLPATLIEEITERYETLGEKYLTDKVSSDGRRINGMMYTDRIANAREEIVDAVFCVLGQILKELLLEKDPPDILYDLLGGLSEIYTHFKVLEHEGDYVVALPM